jgi:hypothetical protein
METATFTIMCLPSPPSLLHHVTRMCNGDGVCVKLSWRICANLVQPSKCPDSPGDHRGNERLGLQFCEPGQSFPVISRLTRSRCGVLVFRPHNLPFDWLSETAVRPLYPFGFVLYSGSSWYFLLATNVKQEAENILGIMNPQKIERTLAENFARPHPVHHFFRVLPLEFCLIP